jgi:hypothetical protein
VIKNISLISETYRGFNNKKQPQKFTKIVVTAPIITPFANSSFPAAFSEMISGKTDKN